MQTKKYIKQMIIILLSFAFLIDAFVPFTAYAEEKEHKVVRVGWYDSSFCYFDSF